MAFQYDPREADSRLLPEGVYEAVIVSVDERVSKKGNDMLVVEYRCQNGGRQYMVKDYITTGMAWKIKKIAQAVNRMDDFEAATPGWLFTLEGGNIRLELSVRTSNEYPDQNNIDGYAPSLMTGCPPGLSERSVSPARTTVAPIADISEDDIPF